MRWLVVALAALVVAPQSRDSAVPIESGFTDTVYVQHAALADATAMAWAPDGSNRLFVTLKNGGVRIVKDGVLLGTPFATLSPVFTNSECGLVGICFDPDFASNGLVYFFATVSASEQQILRYTAAGDLGGVKTVLVGGLPTRGVNHDGGAIQVGPDGKLYWAIGDLGNGTGVDADLTSLATKVGRSNLDGTPAADNPYYDPSDGITATDYVWARGFRNPFTMTFHPVTGDLWLNVAGTNFEQIFLVGKNDHGGWNDHEGGSQPAGYIQPRVSYATNASPFGGCVTGGAFYDAAVFPAEYRNNLFWGDYNSGKIMRSILDSGHKSVLATSTFVTGVPSIVDVSVGPDGALYYARRGGNGLLHRLAYTGSTPQNIVLSTTSLTLDEGESGAFTVMLADAPASPVTVTVARTSGDTDVTAFPSSLSFTTANWNTPQTVTVRAAEDPDATKDGATVTCSSAGLSSRDVAVTVTDDDPGNNAPRASITSPLSGQVVSGTNAEWYGDGADDAGTVRAEFYVDGVLHHTDSNDTGHYHFGGAHGLWDTTALSDGPHVLRMTVYDAANLSGSHEISVRVANDILFGDGFDDGNVDAWSLGPSSGYWSAAGGSLNAAGATTGGWQWEYASAALPRGAISVQTEMTTQARAPSTQGIAAPSAGGSSGVIVAVSHADRLLWSVWVDGVWRGWNDVGTLDRTARNNYKLVLETSRSFAVVVNGEVKASGIDAGSGWGAGISSVVLFTQAQASGEVLNARFDDVVAMSGSLPPPLAEDFNDGDAEGWALNPAGYWSVVNGKLAATGATSGNWSWAWASAILPAGVRSWEAKAATTATAASVHGVVAVGNGGASGVMLAVDHADRLAWSVWFDGAWRGWNHLGAIDRTTEHGYRIQLEGEGTFTVMLDGAVRAREIQAGTGWAGGIAAGLLYVQSEAAGQHLGTQFDDVATHR